MDDKIKELKKIIDESNNIVFFGGAGVSTESGIPDFRSANGIYNMNLGRTVSPEEMISHSFYMRHTEDFYEFYKDKLIYENAQPNNCHKALAELERQGKVKAVVTQNIDGLHQKAGSREVLELHGSVLRNYCTRCGAFYDAAFVKNAEGVPKCTKCGGSGFEIIRCLCTQLSHPRGEMLEIGQPDVHSAFQPPQGFHGFISGGVPDDGDRGLPEFQRFQDLRHKGCGGDKGQRMNPEVRQAFQGIGKLPDGKGPAVAGVGDFSVLAINAAEGTA